MFTVVVYDVVMSGRELAKYAERKGWRFVRHGHGSHDIYAHEDYPYIVSIPMHGSKDIPVGTAAILKKQIDGTWRR